MLEHVLPPKRWGLEQRILPPTNPPEPLSIPPTIPAAAHTLLRALAHHDAGTYRHSLRVGQLAWMLGCLLGAPCIVLPDIYVAGLLHDIGKINTPRSVLTKQTGWTSDDARMLKLHVNSGACLLQQCASLASLAPIVAAHHERPDGYGYPGGLGLAAIPPLALIVAAADAVDVLFHWKAHADQAAVAAVCRVFIAGDGKCWETTVVAAVLHLLQHVAQRPDVVNHSSSHLYEHQCAGDHWNSVPNQALLAVQLWR